MWLWVVGHHSITGEVAKLGLFVSDSQGNLNFVLTQMTTVLFVLFSIAKFGSENFPVGLVW